MPSGQAAEHDGRWCGMPAAGYGSVTVNISAAGPYQFLVRQQKSSSVALWGPPGVLLEWAVQGSAGFDTPRTVSC